MDSYSKLERLWQDQNSAIQQQFHLNLETLRGLKIMKAQSHLNNYLGLNILSLLLGCLFSSFVLFFAFNHAEQTHLLSAGLVLSVWGVFICTGAVMQIRRILMLDYSAPVLKLQQQLQHIRLSALIHTRTAVLIVPFYPAFLLVMAQALLGFDLLQNASQGWLLLHAALSLLLLPATLWLYRALAPENIDKPGIRWLMQGNGSQALAAIYELNRQRRFSTAA
ncbi:hypothetical protein WKI13_02810 [Teredinibacter turnerae]|uniref:hypothetical protein n=1 Tax=Teredinibacter turnerae TaxID=2426 RepID=UPI00037A5FD2|nr:hypothetical protein [Teredinibacter turnerae]